jgi:diguanylate cyclase (GGDEF)-like protein
MNGVLDDKGANGADRFQQLKTEAQEAWDSDPRRLARLAGEMVTIGQDLGDKEFVAIGLRFRGVAYQFLNESVQALSYALEALELFRQLENYRQVAAVQIELGALYSGLGDYVQAVDYFEQSIATSKDIGSRTGRLVSLQNLAHLHRKLCNFDTSLSYCLESLDIAREIQDFENEAQALNIEAELRMLIAQSHQTRGEPSLAMQHLDQARKALEAAYHTAQDLPNAHSVRIETLIAYANFNIAQNDLERAAKLISDALEVAQRSGSPGELARCLQTLSNLHVQRGNLTEARQYLERAQQIFAEQQMKPDLAQSHRELSSVLKTSGDLALALEHFEQFHDLDANLRSVAAEHRAQALAVKLDLERTKRESELYQLRSSELTQLNEQLQTQARLLDRQAREDSLTGLANRRHREEYAFEAFARARERAEPLALVIADIDEFKLVNDYFSHALGDKVLQIVASILRSHCRRGDLAARYGGEEFVLLLSKTTAGDAWHVCERVRQAVRQYPWAALHPELKVTISLGFSDDIRLENHERVLAAADEQLYAAKRAGRNCTRPTLSP